MRLFFMLKIEFKKSEGEREEKIVQKIEEIPEKEEKFVKRRKVFKCIIL